ncbi:hypothetical protein AB1Y20_014907 [Prymnesium parvum]|uniref:EF-hand domain-containing protein n=1 Tax=Prymnesium parvum TaxID=97485 RepID=A0AB34K0X2_PRYPA
MPLPSPPRAPEFILDRYGMWVEPSRPPLSSPRTVPAARRGSPRRSHELPQLPADPRTPRRPLRTAPPAGRTPSLGDDLIPSASLHGARGVVRVRALPDGAPCAGESFEQMTAVEPRWQPLVLPAVTWLFSWVEWHLQAARTELAPVVEAAHRAAAATASEHAAAFAAAQADGLAASIWRAMLSLVFHFLGRVDPLLCELREASGEAAAANARAEALEDEMEALRAEYDEQHAQLQLLLRQRRDDDPSRTEVYGDPSQHGAKPRSLLRQRSSFVSREESLHRARSYSIKPEGARQSIVRAKELEEDRQMEHELSRRLREELQNELSDKERENRRLMEMLEKERRQMELINTRKSRDTYKKQMDVSKQRAQERVRAAQLQLRVEQMREDQADDSNEVRQLSSSATTPAHHPAAAVDSSSEEEGTAGRSGGRAAASGDEEKLSHALVREKSENMRYSRLLRALEDKVGVGVIDSSIRDLGEGWQRKQLCEAASQTESPTPEVEISSGNGRVDKLEDASVEEDLRGSVEEEDEEDDDNAELDDASSAYADGSVDGDELDVVKKRGRGKKKVGLNDSSKSSRNPPENGKPSGTKAKRPEVEALQLRQVEWTIRTLTMEKQKQDAIDEAEKRKRKKLSTFMEGFFMRQHGSMKEVERKQLAFAKGLKGAIEPSQVEKRSGSRAVTGVIKFQVFAAMAGILPFPGDDERFLEEPSAFAFLCDMERKLAERLLGAGKADADKDSGDTSQYMLLERAVELLRDMALRIQELEGMALLEEEIAEDKAARKRGEVLRRDDDETSRKRSVAVVQNKVLRGLAKRGQSMREAFEMMDADGSGELELNELVAGIQVLDSRFSEEQLQQLMELIDVDNSGSVNFTELTRGIKHVPLCVEASDLRRVVWNVYLAELRRSREALQALFNRSFPHVDNTSPIPTDKLRQLLKAYGAPFSDDLAMAVSNFQGDRAEAFAKTLIEMGFDAVGPYDAFREGLTKTVEEIKEVRRLRARSQYLLITLA